VQIGETYLFEGVDGPEGTVGTVTSATINEKEKLAYIAVTRTQGGSVILTQKMTDEAIADYKYMAMPTLATRAVRRSAASLASMNFLSG
jgi:hypothetical protein